VSTRTSGGLLGSNKELEPFVGEALRMAKGEIRVEDSEDDLCEEDNEGVYSRATSILISLAGCGTYAWAALGQLVLHGQDSCEFVWMSDGRPASG
jgi:hypothetical protein